MYSHLFSFVLLLIMSVLVSGATMQKSKGIMSMPLQHMESGLQKLLNTGMDLKLVEGIYEMYRKGATPSQVIKRYGKFVPSNDTLPLYKYFDTQYYGMVNIGKPGRTFKMIMDTAWGYSWVISNQCPKTSLPCALHDKYDHSRSSTYKPDNRPFDISKLKGYISKDVFLVGQINSTNQSFAEITSLPWIYAVYEADGTIGLGFKELTVDYMPFFYNFFSQNKLKEPIFSFYINRDPTTPHGGSLFFGGIDTKHNKTAFTTLPVNSPYYWQFPMDKISVIISKKSRQNFCLKGCNGTADTSAFTIQGPAEDVKGINQLLGAERILFSDRYLVVNVMAGAKVKSEEDKIPCVNEYKGPKISFTLKGKEFVINGRDYIQKLSYSGITVCLSAFQPGPKGLPADTWVLGGAFLYQFYTAYNVGTKEVMIAEVA